MTSDSRSANEIYMDRINAMEEDRAGLMELLLQLEISLGQKSNRSAYVVIEEMKSIMGERNAIFK